MSCDVSEVTESLVRKCYLQEVMDSIASMWQPSVVNTQPQNGTYKVEIRVLLKHYWKQDYKAAVAAARRICEVEGEGVVSERVAQRCFQRFNTGKGNTKDLPHSGRPKL